MLPSLGEGLVTLGESIKGWSGIVGVAAVFHQTAALLLGAASTLLCRAGDGDGAVPAGVGAAAGPAHAEVPALDSLAWRLRPAPGAATSPQAIGPVAARRAPKLQHTAETESLIMPTPQMWHCCSVFIPAAKAWEPWAWMWSLGLECTLGDAAGIPWLLHCCSPVSPQSTHLSWDSATVVMAG